MFLDTDLLHKRHGPFAAVGEFSFAWPVLKLDCKTVGSAKTASDALPTNSRLPILLFIRNPPCENGEPYSYLYLSSAYTYTCCVSITDCNSLPPGSSKIQAFRNKYPRRLSAPAKGQGERTGTDSPLLVCPAADDHVVDPLRVGCLRLNLVRRVIHPFIIDPPAFRADLYELPCEVYSISRPGL